MLVADFINGLTLCPLPVPMTLAMGLCSSFHLWWVNFPVPWLEVGSHASVGQWRVSLSWQRLEKHLWDRFAPLFLEEKPTRPVERLDVWVEMNSESRFQDWAARWMVTSLTQTGRTWGGWDLNVGGLGENQDHGWDELTAYQECEGRGASLVAQWLRICLPMQGTRVQSLVWEDPTCRGATKPVCHNDWACALEPASRNYWACTLESVSHNYWSPCATTSEPACHNYWSPCT